VKRELVYLRAAANGIEQKHSLAEFFDGGTICNARIRRFGWRTSDEAYLGQSMPANELAA
jgi:hypothetical protein